MLAHDLDHRNVTAIVHSYRWHAN